ncbi:MAG TPA: hypothetical protein VLI93_08970, partial [Acetobacteraceae bacterium]|nr:hypothetical protein [Acetobacteraceae bacterium]
MATDTMGIDRTQEAGKQALRLIDQLLTERPQKVGHDFSEAVRCLSAYRDALAEIWRGSGADVDRDRLARVNAVLSVIMGGHFPLGGVPWGHIEKARQQLADVIAGH